MANNITSELRRFIIVRLLYREWDLNPHSHFWPKDFKSFVSTDSTIAARDSQKIGCKVTTLF